MVPHKFHSRSSSWAIQLISIWLAAKSIWIVTFRRLMSADLANSTQCCIDAHRFWIRSRHRTWYTHVHLRLYLGFHSFGIRDKIKIRIEVFPTLHFRLNLIAVIITMHLISISFIPADFSRVFSVRCFSMSPGHLWQHELRLIADSYHEARRQTVDPKERGVAHSVCSVQLLFTTQGTKDKDNQAWSTVHCSPTSRR
jgi:hypothetical protein